MHCAYYWVLLVVFHSSIQGARRVCLVLNRQVWSKTIDLYICGRKSTTIWKSNWIFQIARIEMYSKLCCIVILMFFGDFCESHNETDNLRKWDFITQRIFFIEASVLFLKKFRKVHSPYLLPKRTSFTECVFGCRFI